jgi:hypothetical protein
MAVLMTDLPTLSIVVPTRNRHSYLAKLIEALLRMEAADFEIVIHDNSPDREPYDALCGHIRDRRLRYFFNPDSMSITENFERALSFATGKFVCMIGDDDGVTPAIINVARWMDANGVQAAVAPVSVYLWPGVRSVLDGQQTHGVLRIPRYTGKVRIASEAAALQSVLRSGALIMGFLPSVYQSVISRAALEKLRALTGTYFPGPSPDMSNAVGLASVIDRFAILSIPMVISGACPGSGAAQGASHSHQGEVAEKTFLPADTVERWPPQVPFYFSGPTIWAVSVIHALTRTNRKELLSGLRLDRLYASCFVFNPAYRSRVAQAREKSPGLVSSWEFMIAFCWVWALRAKALVQNLSAKLNAGLRGGAYVAGLPDIGEAISHIARTHGRLMRSLPERDRPVMKMREGESYGE